MGDLMRAAINTGSRLRALNSIGRRLRFCVLLCATVSLPAAALRQAVLVDASAAREAAAWLASASDQGSERAVRRRIMVELLNSVVGQWRC